jgi:hypothetical protein
MISRSVILVFFFKFLLAKIDLLKIKEFFSDVLILVVGFPIDKNMLSDLIFNSFN